jgi:hypothetical protein
MKWYLLVDRRHLGPFSEEEIRQKIQSGSASGEDYLIGVEESDEGSLRYRKILDVFPQWVPQLKVQNTSESEKNKKPALPVVVDRFLGSFSEDEILNNEVSRIFAQELDSTTLLKKSSEQTGITQIPGGQNRPPVPSSTGKLPFSPTRGQIRRVGTPSVGGPSADPPESGTAPSRSAWLLAFPATFLFVSLVFFPFWPGGNPLSKIVQRSKDVPVPASPVGSAGPSISPQALPQSDSRAPASLSIRVPEVSVPEPSRGAPTEEPTASPDSESPRSGRRSAKRLRTGPKVEPSGISALEKLANERDDGDSPREEAPDRNADRGPDERDSNVDDSRENREAEKPPSAETENSENPGSVENPSTDEEPGAKKEANGQSEQEE